MQISLWALSPGVVDGILPFQDDLRNWNESVPFLQQTLNNARQSLRRVLRCVVEQYYGAGTHFLCHPLRNIRRGQIFPFQAVPAGSGWKLS